MIIQLRRRHYYTWLSLAVLLPLGVILAYVNIPQKAEDTFGRKIIAAYPTISRSQQTDDLKINIRSNSDGKQQIEVIILKPLIGAANQLYASNSSKLPQQILLGALESRGLYRFSLPDSLTKSPIILTIYDVIKQKKVESLTIK